MTNHLTLLGTGSCELDPGRGASSALIQLEDLSVVFDFGRGTARSIAQCGVTQNQLRHIVISHFHPDHSSDLIPYLHAACWARVDRRTEDLHIYGPPGIAALVDRITSIYEPHELLCPERFALRVHEVGPQSLEIEGHTFEFVDLPEYSNHGLALTVGGKRYALTADSYFHEQEVQFVTGAEVAVIDCGHQSSAEIVELALRAQPKLLVLSHVYETPAIEGLLREARLRGFHGAMELAVDGRRFVLGDPGIG